MTPFALVLLAPASHEAALTRIASDLRSVRGDVAWSAPVWLGAGEAIEVGFVAESRADAAEVRAAIAAARGRDPVDVYVVPAVGRRKRLLIADMDSTIIGQECIDEMADVLGLKAQVAAITERAMHGDLEFEDALRARLGLLAGITEAQLEAVFRERVRLNPGARTLLATMRRNGACTALVSGGFTFFTSRVAAAAGFDENHANVLELVDGRLTGQVVGPILGREAKLATLERLRIAQGLADGDTLAVGDGANDLAMIRAAGLGVAYHARPIVAGQAHAAIEHADLTALLYLQGFRREEMVRLD